MISHRLYQFYAQALGSDLPEAHRLSQTIEAWWPAVLAAITTGHTKARSEGYNRLAKHVGSDAFGFRNPTNHRRRIRWACNRQHRRETAKKTTQPGQLREAAFAAQRPSALSAFTSPWPLNPL